MPQLSDLMEKRKFVKKEYRPWDLTGTGVINDGEVNNESPSSEATTTVSAHESSLDQPPEIIINQNPPKNIQTATGTGNNTGNISDNNKITTEKQTGSNQITKKKQQDNIRVTIREHQNNITDNVTGNADEFIYLVNTIKKLSGIQKNIFLYIIHICTARGTLDTGNILSSDLADAAQCSVGSAKTSLIRLLQKHLVIRLQGKASRGGHMVLGVTKEIQAAAIQAQKALFNPFKSIATDNITGNITNNMLAYSSSNINKITTTSLPEDWKKINFDGLIHIGFSETQLKQLCDTHLTTVEIIQESINHFAFGLTHSEKTKAYKDPLNVFMGVLRKGQRWIEADYIPPQELALKQLLEEKKKAKERRDLLIKELVDIDFPEWKKKLSENEVKRIVPEDILKMNLTSAITASLRTYYVENILLPKLEKNENHPK